MAASICNKCSRNLGRTWWPSMTVHKCWRLVVPTSPEHHPNLTPAGENVSLNVLVRALSLGLVDTSSMTKVGENGSDGREGYIRWQAPSSTLARLRWRWNCLATIVRQCNSILTSVDIPSCDLRMIALSFLMAFTVSELVFRSNHVRKKQLDGIDAIRVALESRNFRREHNWCLIDFATVWFTDVPIEFTDVQSLLVG